MTGTRELCSKSPNMGRQCTAVGNKRSKNQNKKHVQIKNVKMWRALGSSAAKVLIWEDTALQWGI